MSTKYRHSDGAGGHTFYPGVVGEPMWDEEAHTLTLNFEDGETRTFGPNEDGERVSYGRLLFRDESVDPETGYPVMAPSEPDQIVYHCTFDPLGEE